MTDKQIGKSFKAKRQAKGLKASWVAVEMGLSPQLISMLEFGKRKWDEGRKAAYLKAIGE